MAASPVKSFGIRDLLGLPETGAGAKENCNNIESLKYNLHSTFQMTTPEKTSSNLCPNSPNNFSMKFSPSIPEVKSESFQGLPVSNFLPLHLPLSLGVNSPQSPQLGSPYSMKSIQTLSGLALGLQTLAPKSAVMSSLLDLASSDTNRMYSLDICDLERLSSSLALSANAFQNSTGIFSPNDSRLSTSQHIFSLESGE